MKSPILILPMLLCLLAVTGVRAQNDQPTVEIVVSQSTARQGDVITAEVYIRDAVNLGRAIVGIAVDGQCLRIVGYEAGLFMPTTAPDGVIGPRSEYDQYDMQMEVVAFGQENSVTGDGVLYSADLEVTCFSGLAPLEVTFALLESYGDTGSEAGGIITYNLIEGSVTVRNAEVEIVDATVVPTDTPTLTPTPTPSRTATPTPAPPTRTPVPVPEKPRDPIVSVIVLPIVCIALFLLVLVFWVVRRLSR